MYGKGPWKVYETKLLVTEREIFRRIFGLPKDRDGSYVENRTNDELSNLIRNKNMVNCIEAQKFSWFWPCTPTDRGQGGQKMRPDTEI
jgi:hypothetical protein